MDVSTWTPLSPLKTKGSTSRRGFQLSPATAGWIGTLLLHGLVLQTVLLGSRAIKMRPPDVQGSGATNFHAEVSPSETLILLELPSTPEHAHLSLEDLASLGQAPKNLIMTVISADPLPRIDIPQDHIGDEQDPVAVTDSEDPAGRARLVGLYSGQIQARIERGWRRPRTPVDDNDATSNGAPSDKPFQCQAQIVQDATGNVQEVLLPNCHGSAAWQRSLVIAIQQSSPLPAPPNPNVFSHTITLNFIGYGFTRGANEGEYEIQAGNMAQASAR